MDLYKADGKLQMAEEEVPDKRWTFGAEILPDNERTAEIMKKREEKEELLRVKSLEMKQM